MSNIEEQLCIVFMYTGNLSIISTISQFESDSKMYTFHLIWSAFVYDVWTTDLGFCEETRTTPITDPEKNGEREKQKYMRGSEKGSHC
jgi:hypothetical protein